MTSVARISPHLDIQCPEPLRNLPIWLVWRYEGGESGKPRKVPYYAGGGRRKGVQGTPQDRARLVTFDAALAAARRGGFDGVGAAILEGCGFVAVDFDDVVQNAAHFAAINQMLKGTYAEFSPSGNGVRGFVRDTGAFRNIKSHAREGNAYTFETFATAGFVTFTGNVLPSVELVGSVDDIAAPSPELLALYEERLAARGGAHTFDQVISGDALGYSIEELADILKRLDPSASYEQWIQIGMALHHETGGSEEGFELWDSWSSAADNYLSTEDCLSHWSSFRRNTGAVVTARTLLKLVGDAGGTVGSPVATADDFDVIEDTPEEVAERKAKASHFQVIYADDFSNRPPPKYLIQDVLPQADLAIVYGDSGSGKSFVVTDMAMAIARGLSWRGLKTRQGRVVYIVAEGGGGYSLRLKAYAMHHQISLAGIPFGIINAAPNLLAKDDIRDVIAAIKAFGGADLVILDTLAQTTPGANENAAEDMGLAIKNARAIARAAGGMALLVHHSGKDASKGARGWSGMRAAADAQFEVIKAENGTRVIQTTKQKDGKDDGRWGFRLEDVVVAMDDEGDAVSSCVVVEDVAPERPSTKPKPERLGAWEQLVMETLAELQLGGDVLKTDLTIRVADKVPEKGTLKFRRASARRALDNLSKGKKAILAVEEGYVFERE